LTEARKERKVVTCLFCDLVGSTAAAESADPEDVAERLGAYHSHVRGELERFGGTVEKFIGDAVMALFGAPVAHEDDPERAVRAALAIRDWARDEGELEVRIGITTGEALISLGARPEAGEGMASGDVINTGSRLQSAAPTNGVLVDETTYRATERAIEYREAEPVEAKGKAEPVPVWEPLETRAVVGIELRPETSLVGRERERELLVDALERVRREAEPQLVTLVGVPGIGKSRLVAELFAEVERDPELIFWRHGRSLPYGEGVAFWAFAEMVKAQAGVLNSDTEEVAAEKLHEAVAAAVEEADASWVEARLQPLLGLGERADDRDESFGAWRRFVEELAEQRPTVLVFEDLHWADDDLLDFVDYVVDWARGVPLLVLGTARPELLDRRPGWGGGKRNATTVSLPPLDDVETAKLIAGLLERAVLPAETQEALLQRAGGNPLYAEQFARMLDERGDAAELPETVQGIIAARLDALPEAEKTLLQDAAVIGKSFWTRALETVSGVDPREAEGLLHALERKEFVRRERRSSVESEAEHSFAHLLVRDVAYSQIPRAARAERHRLAAEWIESLGRSEDRAELLAHHYLAAIELGTAAGSDTSSLYARAREAFVEAARRAAALNAFDPAERYLAAALEITPEEHPRYPYVVLQKARFSQYGEIRAVSSDPETLANVVETLLAAGDVETAAEAKLVLARFLWNEGDSAAAQQELQAGLELLEETAASRLKAELLSEGARYAMLARTPEDAVRLGREALALAEQLGLDSLRATLLNTIGTARGSMDDPEGIKDLERSLELALEIGHPGEIHRAYNNLMEESRINGNWAEASRLLGKLHENADRFGLRGSLRWIRGEEAMDGLVTGRWDMTVAAADRIIAAAEAGHPHYLEPVVREIRARIRLARGDDGGARDDSARAVELGRGSDPQVSCSALASRAFILVTLGAREEASVLASEVLAIPAYFYGAVNLACVLHDLGRGNELAAWAEQLPPAWQPPAEAIAAGRFHDAAEALAGIGDLSNEAYCRLRSGTESNVRRALEFYRSVEATRYMREGEALLAATA
jgi:class 3 adenylate cyclase